MIIDKLLEMKNCNLILTKKILKRPSHETCDFCEATFSNKYDLSVHNASHMIIPLIKLNLLQCDQCLYFYYSKEELSNHILTAHPNQLKQNIPIEKEYNWISEKTIKEKVKYENELSLHLLNDFTTDCKVTVESLFPASILKNKTDSVLVKSEYSGILRDVTTDCKVAVESFPPEIIEGIVQVCNGSNNSSDCNAPIKEESTNCKISFKPTSSDEIQTHTSVLDSSSEEIWTSKHNEYEHQKGSIANINYASLNEQDIDNYNQDNFANRCTIFDDMLIIRPKGSKIDSEYTSTIPYEVLKETGIFKCQHCDKTFKNRLKMIKHETVHIVFKRTLPQLCLICDKYIAGSSQDLKKHVAKKHSFVKFDKYISNICEICHFPYRKLKHHVKYYHHLHCYICFNKFNSILDKQLHMTEHTYSCTTLQICDFCMSFLKPKTNIKYINVGTQNIPGEQQTCYDCGKKFLEINLVKRHIHNKNYSRKHKGEGRGPITNEERLKNIQQRLKLMKV